ncbi:MAG: glycoside hydrolase family 44 protein [Chloroflexota bacterium]
MSRRRAPSLAPRIGLGLAVLVGALVPAGAVSPVAAADPGPDLVVDASKDRHAISPDIYGVNFAGTAFSKAQLRSMGITLDRWGGNSTTRYDFTTGFHNTGSDWYFENIPPDTTHPLPHAALIEADRAAGVRSIITMPLIGWTPRKDSPTDHPFACGFPASAFPNQESTDPYDPHCGNGVKNGHAVTGNDPTVTSRRITPSTVKGWVASLVARYGRRAAGGVAYVELDNEPALWDDTHRDVSPDPLTYDGLLARTVAYAKAIKAADPTVRTLGPSDWGWCAYVYSPADPGGCSDGADRKAHGDLPFVAWYLRRLHALSVANGKRLLDVLDEHYYPQSGVALRDAGDAATQALRLRSTRSLWDPTYIDESWISDLAQGGVAVKLIPRLKAWVRAEYPGTKLGITEYNFGGLESLNGALAQADVLGILGREGVDLATLWDPGAASDPWAFAFRMFRNHDGAGVAASRFGETSVRARSVDAGQPDRPNGGQDRLAAYAAVRRSDGALTVMVINKTATDLASELSIAGFTPAATAHVWRYSNADLGAIDHAPDADVTGGAVTLTYPARSITLLVVPRAS